MKIKSLLILVLSLVTLTAFGQLSLIHISEPTRP